MSWVPEGRIRVPSSQQRWSDLTFVHVGYEPAGIASLLPRGLEPDTYDDLAWVGITPFRMEASVLPVVSGPRRTVGEANVRTYVRDRRGRDGILFLSLELDDRIVARALRTTVGLPYRAADVGLERSGDTIRYRVDRHGADGRGHLELGIEVGDRIPEDAVEPFEVFLVGRWRAYVERFGRLFTVPVEHPPWPLHRADLLGLDNRLLPPQGQLPAPRTDPHVLFSPGVRRVRLGLPRSV